MDLPRGCGIKVVCLLGLTLFSIGVDCSPLGSRRGLAGGETVFDIRKFGAIADGESDSALAMIDAWKAACNSKGPARVLIPKGEFMASKIVFQGPCSAPKPITIDLQGTILGTKDPTELSGTDAGMSIDEVDGVILAGGGTYNGQGEAMWQYNVGGGNILPISILFTKATNCQMRNLNILNAKGVHIKVTDSSNILVENLHITAPGDSPNTDGLHISDSTNVTVTNSVIATGDDCISIGDTNTGIAISKIFCGPGHGISVGSLGKHPNEADVKDVSVINCTFTKTTNGARIKTYMNSKPLKVSNVVYEDIILNEVKNPIIIDQHYNSKNVKEPSKVKITDVHFRNFRGTTISKIPVSLNCSEAVPCEGVELKDIEIVAAPGAFKKAVVLTSACANAKFAVKGKLNPAGC